MGTEAVRVPVQVIKSRTVIILHLYVLKHDNQHMVPLLDAREGATVRLVTDRQWYIFKYQPKQISV